MIRVLCFDIKVGSTQHINITSGAIVVFYFLFTAAVKSPNFGFGNIGRCA